MMAARSRQEMMIRKGEGKKRIIKILENN